MVSPVTDVDSSPVSDGTMPCPVPHPDGADAPCTKPIPKGWTAAEGHGGGHFWMGRETAAALDRGDHYDAHAALSGRPFTFHRPSECPGFPDCNDWRAKPRPVRAALADSGDTVRPVVVETKPCTECGGTCTRRPGGWSCIHNAGCNADWKRERW